MFTCPLSKKKKKISFLLPHSKNWVNKILFDWAIGFLENWVYTSIEVILSPMASNSWGIDKLIEKNSQIYKPIVSNTSFSLTRNNKLKHTAREREKRLLHWIAHPANWASSEHKSAIFSCENSAFLMSSHFRFQAGNLVRWRLLQRQHQSGERKYPGKG